MIIKLLARLVEQGGAFVNTPGCKNQPSTTLYTIGTAHHKELHMHQSTQHKANRLFTIGSETRWLRRDANYNTLKLEYNQSCQGNRGKVCIHALRIWLLYVSSFLFNIIFHRRYNPKNHANLDAYSRVNSHANSLRPLQITRSAYV